MGFTSPTTIIFPSFGSMEIDFTPDYKFYNLMKNKILEKTKPSTNLLLLLPRNIKGIREEKKIEQT
jgi:hypothetical protein